MREHQSCRLRRRCPIITLHYRQFLDLSLFCKVSENGQLPNRWTSRPAGCSNTPQIPWIQQSVRRTAATASSWLPKSTCRISRSDNWDRPSGCSALLTGLGPSPVVNWCSLARLQVSHGGPAAMPQIQPCTKASMKVFWVSCFKISPYSKDITSTDRALMDRFRSLANNSIASCKSPRPTRAWEQMQENKLPGCKRSLHTWSTRCFLHQLLHFFDGINRPITSVVDFNRTV